MARISLLPPVVWLFVSLCVAGAGPSSAQLPRLVKDLNTSGDGSGAYPQAEMGGFVYLIASEPDHGGELWKTDGTAEGTTLVKDVWPGPTSSDSFYVVNAGGTVFFAPDTEEYGRELWKSDGTEAGTVLVKDTLPGPMAGFPERFVAVGERLFFVARDEQLASELWVSDGTEAGTRMVKDISVGDGCCGADPLRLTASGGKLFFRADDGVHGDELWVSDGTEAGTRLVKDIFPGERGSTPDQLFDFEGTLFFSASDPDQGEEPWKSDGTEAGTVLVRDIWPGSRSSFPYGMAVVGDTLFFEAEDQEHGAELWKSDGTLDGTVLVADSVPGEESGGAFSIVDVGGKAFFFAADQEDEFSNPLWALWTSDGTEAGTRRLREVHPGTLGFGDNGTLEFKGELIFSGGHTDRDIELWKSDGTEAGTGPIKDIFPGEAQSLPLGLTRLGDRVLFSAEDDEHGRELWSTDGTESGTAIVRDINSKGTLDASPTGVAELNGVLYFAASEKNSGRELWRTDGTAAGTFIVRDMNPDNGRRDGVKTGIEVAGGKLFFFADDGEHDQELWTSDGTRSGTRLVRDLFPDELSSGAFGLTATEKYAYFAGFDDQDSLLWRSDGTEAGTVIVHRERNSNARPLGSLGELLFFDRRGELWRSDGTAAGTFAIAEVGVAGGFKTRGGELVPVGDILLFTPSDFEVDLELWRSDGTRAGTYVVKDIAPGPSSSYPQRLVEHQGLVYFQADDGVHGTELWQSDGTAAGTSMVRDLSPGAESSVVWPLDGVDGAMFFAASTAGLGSGDRSGLWTTRGAGRETRFVSASAQPFFEPAKAFGSYLYFTNRHPFGTTLGAELWRSDGTRKGTTLVADLQPGSRDSSPSDYTVAGRNLFFTATSGRYGRELWVLGAGTASGVAGKLTAVPDLDGLGGDEVAALFTDVVVRDTASGQEILETPFAPRPGWEAVDFEPMADVNGNGSAELAVLARKRNRVRVFTRDALTGGLLSTLRLKRNQHPLDLEVIPGAESSLAVLARRGLGGKARLVVRNLSGGKQEFSLAGDFEALDLEVAPAVRGATPALVVLGQSGPEGRARVLALDAESGLVRSDVTLAAGLLPVDLEIVQKRPNAPPRAAVLLENRTNGAVRVLTIDLRTGETLRTLRFGRKYRPLDLEPEPGLEGSAGSTGSTGSAGPAVSLLEARRSNGKVRVSTRNAFSGRRLGKTGFSGILLALDLATVRDLGGSAGFEVVVLGEADCADGGAAIVARDSETGARLGCHPVEWGR